MIYWISYFLMKVVDLGYFNTKFHGRENIPAKEPFILASNHISNIDPFVLGICYPRRFSFLAKDSLFRNKIIGFFFRGMGAFPIKRETSDFGALRESLRRLKSGSPLIVFPEGTRGTGPIAKKPQPGIGFIASKSKLPIFPAYISGTEEGLPNGAKWFKRHPVSVTIGRPVEFSADLSYEEISKLVVKEILALGSPKTSNP